ncbi:hypothetical protein [Legionella sp. km772]|uniref:hypothetical protein n=1 Tax=Legionella sp. km772 TaxID=2498111 RepID=UPI000F8E68C4|nr:hypothetical protein [Legionella sp. km772]RUR12153.1 hypothetical protein ELY15_06015 [Legionella sp. km772]
MKNFAYNKLSIRQTAYACIAIGAIFASPSYANCTTSAADCAGIMQQDNCCSPTTFTGTGGSTLNCAWQNGKCVNVGEVIKDQ